MKLKDKLPELSKEQLSGLIKHMAENPGVITMDSVVPKEGCAEKHDGECGVCVGDTFVPCGG